MNEFFVKAVDTLTNEVKRIWIEAEILSDAERQVKSDHPTYKILNVVTIRGEDHRYW